MVSTPFGRPGQREIAVAALTFLVVVGGAFFAASLTQHQPLFSLSPPGQSAHDIEESHRLVLHRAFFTAWAALILATPAFCTFWFRSSSARAAHYWLAFWSVAQGKKAAMKGAPARVPRRRLKDHRACEPKHKIQR
jgi:hypothetical protein